MTSQAGNVKQVYVFNAWWDPAAGLWRCQNTELSYADSATTYDQLAKQLGQNRASIMAANSIPTYGGYEIDFVMQPTRVILRLK
jgi:hypothetical protein